MTPVAYVSGAVLYAVNYAKRSLRRALLFYVSYDTRSLRAVVLYFMSIVFANPIAYVEPCYILCPL